MYRFYVMVIEMYGVYEIFDEAKLCGSFYKSRALTASWEVLVGNLVCVTLIKMGAAGSAKNRKNADR
jgi:hypothetical protein